MENTSTQRHLNNNNNKNLSRSSTPRSKTTLVDKNNNRKQRAPWDLRGKIEDLGSKATEQASEIDSVRKLTEDLESTLGSTTSETQEALDRVYELETMVKVKIYIYDIFLSLSKILFFFLNQTKREQHQLALKKLKLKHQQQNRQLEESNYQYEQRLGTIDIELNDIRSKTSQLLRDWEAKTRDISQLRSSVETAYSTMAAKEAQLTEQTKKLQETDCTLMERQKTLEELTDLINSTRKRRFEIDSQLLEEEKVRRKLHNTLQELKGNIRVFCRMRPSLASERTHDGAVAQVRFFGKHGEKMEFTEQVMSSTITGKMATKTYPFSFDKIFSPEHSQQDCFEEIAQLVQSALDGYHVCIFAYGQTGSGKTYTMQGPSQANDDSSMGMIPRAVLQIYQAVQMLTERGWTYSMEGQFLEIYNEVIHDLLGDVSEYGKIKHEIRHEKNGKTSITGMTTVKLDSPTKVKLMLRKANQNRATGATLLNERSSRSHSVFILRLEGHNATTGEQTSGVLNLIDLAGSERLATSGSTGDRLTEAKAINKSLSCLGDVIHALARNKEGCYIPYRNSKLTYLLQNSLGGNSKTLMFVNISPLTEHFGETLCSLRFATKVNSCRIGVARKMK
ncbi:kinesin-1 [Halteromyces radiatus]|uniref:kinesin-1 n=1 Tax=Halteromyces radiatus TaxID=101107 RepID=UPI00221FFE76|nr:kinesin-1 [Halteromyces radiatus]KAI8086791.1 kinesin-1 [Halteromyces radiatus]